MLFSKQKILGIFLLALMVSNVFVGALSSTVFAAYTSLPTSELPRDIQNLEVSYRSFEVACESKVNGDEGTGGRWNSANGALNNTGNYENDKDGNFPCVQQFLAFYKNRRLCYSKGLENGWTFKIGSPSNPTAADQVKNEHYNEGKDITYLMRVGKECVAKVVSEARHEKVSDIISQFESKCGTAAKYNNNKSACEGFITQLADYADCNEPSSISDAKIKSYVKECQNKNDSARSDENNAASGGNPSGASSTDDTPCLGGALGWVLCPVIDIMINGIKVAASFIDSMMQFRILADNSSGKALRDASAGFTNIANILLVIAFLFIIVSQATSYGISNYGVKKMLPRLAIAGVLINISFYLCAFAIDISNIAGASIMGFMAEQNTVSESLNKQIGGNGGEGNVFGPILGGIALVVLVVLFLGPLLLGVLLTFFMLVARQIILICLVVVAPVAIAAWLLPNTESFFNKWRKLFTDMLMAYPLVMFIFGAAIWSAKLIGTIALAENNDPNASNPAFGDSLASLIQLVVLAIPLLALPFILKGSSAALGKVAGMAEKYGAGRTASGVGKLSGVAKGGLKNTALNAEARMANSGVGPLNRVGGFRTRRTMNKKRREELRGQIQEEAYYGFMEGNEGRQNRSVGRSLRNTNAGQQQIARLSRQSGGYAAAKERERVAEELKHAELHLDAIIHPGPNQGNEFRDALTHALEGGNEVEIRAIMKKISTEGGKSEIANMGNVIQAYAQGNGGANGNQALSGAAQQAVAQGTQDNWGAVKGADPLLANLDLATGQQRGGAPSIAQEQLSSMDGRRLQQLAAAGHISDTMVGEAAASGMLKGLDTSRRAQLEQGLTQHATQQNGGVPVQPVTIEDLRQRHDAAPIIQANNQSDRRLKKDIVQVGTYNGIPLYKFTYIKENSPSYVGVMAQDILETHPAAVAIDENGYYSVQYSQLGLRMITYEEWSLAKDLHIL